MFTHYQTKGVVLSYTNIKEADRFFILYTKEFGKIGVMGRSIRKIESKLRMKMELFSLIEAGFISGKSYNTLVDVESVNEFKDVKKNLAKLSFFYQLAETFLSLIIEEERDEEVYSLLVNTFKIVNDNNLSSNNLKTLYCLFSFQLLHFLGHKMYISNCAVCGVKTGEEGYFNAEEGGVICFRCFNQKKDNSVNYRSSFIYLESIAKLKLFFQLDTDKMFNQETDTFIKILTDYLEVVPRKKNTKV